ncbi:MAG: TRAP transporter large permease subunit [Chitinispirillaceae bacterium]|nr:TRAP transporter large permease subunit [Chitinispirillaceae bacterium]
MRRVSGVLSALPQWLTACLYLLLALLPLLESLFRMLLHRGIPASAEYTKHIVLWITFLGGVYTTIEGRHLAFTAGLEAINPLGKKIAHAFSSFLCITFCLVLCLSALSFCLIGINPVTKIGLFALRPLAAIIPLCYGMMLIVFIRKTPAGALRWTLAGSGLLLGSIIGQTTIVEILRFLFSTNPGLDHSLTMVSSVLSPVTQALSLPLIALLIAAAFAGMPIFLVFSGITLLLFTRCGGVLAVVPNEAYTILTGPAIPAIPLFALAGFVLANGKAGSRLVDLFRAFLGWMPGGLAMVAVLLCAFFTTFTGASGVTILVLGGLFSFILVNNGYRRNFSLGLLTASGSIGLLFPPALPVILYGVMAQINIKHMYIACLLPGLIMVVTLIFMGLFHAKSVSAQRQPFILSTALRNLKNAAWEVLLPVIVFTGFFSGFFTVVETAAVAAVYALISQTIIHRDIPPAKLPEMFRQCLVLVGGVLVIIAAARGLSYYIVDAEIPTNLAAWAVKQVHSKYLFLLLLNFALIITGCLMDIYSAIIVIVPLILPVGRAFGIDPIHLGIIFLANMELGYLTPPVGLNLFLSSYTFNEPIAKISRLVLPFLLLLFLNVILITYWPGLTSILLQGAK